MRCKLSGVFIISEHTCGSVVLIIKTVPSNFEHVKYSSFFKVHLKESVLVMSSTRIVRTAVVRKPGLGLVSFGLVLGLVVLVLVSRIWSCSHHWFF